MKKNDHLKEITPINGYHLIQRLPEDRKSSIIISDESKELNRWGIVLKTSVYYDKSTGVQINPRVTVGDIVFMEKYAGDGESEFLLVREVEIIGISRGDA
jgi:co-chaperonin GroES (HSP10)